MKIKSVKKKKILSAVSLMLSATVVPTVLASCTLNEKAVGQYEKITTISTNDTHGRFDEKSSSKAGLKYIAAYADAHNPDLLLDVGDLIQGTAMSNLDKGETILEIANYMGYDAIAVGNHEFDFGFENFQTLAEKTVSPFIAANVRYSTTPVGQENNKPSTGIKANEVGERILPPSVVKTIRGDLKVGIIGIATPETKTTTHPKNVENLEFTDVVEETKMEIKELKKQNINFITVLSHTGQELATQIATELGDDVDLIIDGHSHVNYQTQVGNTYIMQSGSYGDTIRHTTFDFNKKTGLIENFKSKSVESDELLQYKNMVDINIENKIAKLRNNLNKEFSKTVVENLPYKLNGDREDVRRRETNLGNLAADAYYSEANKILAEKTPGSKVDFAILNSGGIRASIKEGKVTEENLYDVFPFGNFLAVADVPGKNIIEAFKRSVTTDGLAGYMLQVSEQIQIKEENGKFTFKIKKEGTQEFVDIDESKTYKIATLDFLFAGGDGYSMLDYRKPENNIKNYASFLEERNYLRKYFIQVFGSNGTQGNKPLSDKTQGNTPLSDKYKDDTKQTRLLYTIKKVEA